MITETSAVATLPVAETKASVLITISTPGIETAICRLSNSEEVVRGLTVRDLIQRVTSPNSLFSVGVPINQLQAESSAALAIGELLRADCCEVVLPGRGGAPDQRVGLYHTARAAAKEQIGSQGNRFLNINLEIRSLADTVAPTGEDRRQLPAPSACEVEQQTGDVLPASATSGRETEKLDWMPPSPRLHAADPQPDAAVCLASAEPAGPAPSIGAEALEDVTSAESDAPPAPTPSIPEAGPLPAGFLTIVAGKAVEEEPVAAPERKEYVRKADWLRAQFLPEVDALDFSGLFVGNLGMGIREEKARRNVMLADPARITELLLRANGHRRSEEHARALICYQELVDMDSANADFRFLLGKTLLALGQKDEAAQAFLRAKELGHDGADKELSDLRRSGHRPRAALGFLKFWK